MTTSVLKSLQPLDILVEKITALTGITRTEISQEISDTNIPSYQFKDTLLVSPEDFGVMIDNWAVKIKSSLGLKGEKEVETVPDIVEISSESMAPDLTPESSVESESTTAPIVESPQPTVALSWPEGFQTAVSHLYGPSLKRILPQDLAQRRLYLEAIAQETVEGLSLVEELADVITQKYSGPGTLSKEKAMLGIMKKANAMLTNS